MTTPRDALPNTTALARAEALHVILTGADRAALPSRLATFRLAMEGQRRAGIDACRADLNALIETFRQGT